MDREIVGIKRRGTGKMGMGVGRMDGKMMGSREMGSRGMEKTEREMRGIGRMRMGLGG